MLRRQDVLRRPARPARRAPRARVHGHGVLRGHRRRARRRRSSDALGLKLGERAEDKSVSLAETVCLGYCHASPAVRDGDVIDAGPGAIERLLAGASQPAPEPRRREPARRARAHPPRRLVRLRRAHARPRSCSRRSRPPTSAAAAAPASRPATSGSSRRKRQTASKVIVANGDEGDPGSYIDKLLMEDNPHLLLEGMALAGFAVGAEPRVHPRPLRVPALQARAGQGGRARRAPRGHSASLRHHRDRGRRLLRRRRGDRAARAACRACAAPSPRGRRSPPSAASTACRPWSTTSRRSATSPSSPSTAPRPTAR